MIDVPALFAPTPYSGLPVGSKVRSASARERH